MAHEAPADATRSGATVRSVRHRLGPRTVALVVVASLAPACGDGRPTPQATGPLATTSTTSPTPGRPATLDLSQVAFEDATDQRAVEVVARDNRFEAPYLEVAAGTAVTFANEGSHHDVTPAVPGAFGGIAAEDFGSGTVTFSESGDYVYYCSIHGKPNAGQHGVVHVTAA